MKLFTKTIDKKLFAQYDKGSDLKNQKVIAKIFNPYGRGTWYILNSDPEDPDYLWAITDLFEIEIGSVSRNELENIKVPPFRLPLERDMYFDEINAYELYQGLKEGKRYDDGGYMANGGQVNTRELNKKIKDYYIKTYPTDDLGQEINDKITFKEFWAYLSQGYDVYDVLEVSDSLVRERVFQKLSEIYAVDYDVVYKMWLRGSKYGNGGYMADGGIVKNINEDLVTINAKLKRLEEINSEDAYRQTQMLRKQKSALEALLLIYDDEPKNTEIMYKAGQHYPKSSNGGYMANGGNVSTKYAIVDEDTDRIYFKSTDKKFVELKFKEFQEIYPTANLSIIEFTNSYANGGYMADGGGIGDDFGYHIINKEVELKNGKRIFLTKGRYFWSNELGDDSPSGIYYLTKDGEFISSDMVKFPLKAKGGYMAKGGEMKTNVSNFGKKGTGFDNPKYKVSYDQRGVMLKPTTDFKTLGSKLVVSKLANGSYKWDVVLQNGDIYQTKTGFNTSDDAINDYMKSSYAKGGYMAGGGFLKDAKYVSKRNISSITLEVDGKSVTLKGEDLVDGVYVKKTQSATKSATKTKVDTKEVANKLTDLSYDVWDKLKIESGSQIYASDATQKKLNKEFKTIGIDEIYSKLTKPERKKVSDILTDENQHSLRNYLGLRGYNGEQEFNSYKTMFEESKNYKRPYVLNPKNFDRVLAEGAALGDSTYLVKVAEEYAEKEYGKKVKKGAGVAKAKKVGDKYDYSQVTVFFQDGTQETFEREDFEEFFEIED